MNMRKTGLILFLRASVPLLAGNVTKQVQNVMGPEGGALGFSFVSPAPQALEFVSLFCKQRNSIKDSIGKANFLFELITPLLLQASVFCIVLSLPQVVSLGSDSSRLHFSGERMVILGKAHYFLSLKLML